jgi:hypothetical protein
LLELFENGFHGVGIRDVQKLPTKIFPTVSAAREQAVSLVSEFFF